MVSILIIPGSVLLGAALGSTGYKVINDNAAITIPAVATGIYVGSLAKRSVKGAFYVTMAGASVGALWYGHHLWKKSQKPQSSPPAKLATHHPRTLPTFPPHEWPERPP